MAKKVAIVGAGVLGRLTALRLAARGVSVTVFDRGMADGLSGTASVAAGMLAPGCELESAEPLIFDLGIDSLEAWPALIRETLGSDVFFQREGSLVISHPHDRAELERFRSSISSRGIETGMRPVHASELRELEPHVDARFMSGLYFPLEGQIDTGDFLSASAEALGRLGAECRFETEVKHLSAGLVGTASGEHPFDLVIDCRGMGAKSDCEDLRGVRGEILTVRAPGVRLNRPVRLMHPRYPLYIAPRPDSRFLIGATQIESEDESPVSVRSALELLSAAYAVSAGFSEGRILDMKVGLRPAFPDHLPRILLGDGMIRVNGLFRHGFLIGPKLSELVSSVVMGESLPPRFEKLLMEAA